MDNPQRSTTTTQYSTTTYDDDTIDGSDPDAESDQDGDSEDDDRHTIRSFAPPRTPTNSLVSFKVPKTDGGVGSRRRGKGREGAAGGVEDQTAEGTASQLDSVVEIEETSELGGSTTVGGSFGSSSNKSGFGVKKSRTSRVTQARSLGAQLGSGLPSRSQDADDELLDEVQELPMSRGTGTTSEMISSTSASTWTDRDDYKGNKDKDDGLILDPNAPDSLNAGQDLEEAQDGRERDKRILEQLGYSEVLGRDYGFWASFSVGYCVIGGFQGAVLSTHVAWSYGGPQ